MNEDLQQRWERVCDRLANSGFTSLGEPERLWVSIRGLIDAVNDGGIPSYFYNSWADYLPECKKGLETLGCPSVVVQVDRACALFPTGVPASQEARNEIIDAWEENIDSELHDIDRQLRRLFPDLEEKLDSYISENLR